ncbi:MAG TPA: UDP-N-acetylglucosamine 2-epimerase (non-hydrolyzing) [Usitatibacter sp.]|nr:UDP-N-acetylglucosamine 2-epimerase (non-hydrolyzing) [Usitatibacter sp.]
MTSRTFLACMGTRPEIIKMAILHRTLRSRGHRVVVLHTGQHGEMAHDLYRLFDMPPDIEVTLRRDNGTLAGLTSELINGVDSAIREARPDAVIVQGDTTSALAGGLVGYYHGSPVAHVEAGLRTHERDPFPEEKNRELLGRLARWHFAPTERARRNLLGEGIGEDRIHEVGNTGIDAAIWARDSLRRREFTLREYAADALCTFLETNRDRPLVLVTAHRRENWGSPITEIARALVEMLERHGEAIAVWPAHPNPDVRDDIERGLREAPAQTRLRILVTEPLEYPGMIAMLSRCRFTLTDSGGVQEEAAALDTPVLIARNSTERQELVEAGGARLVGTDAERIVREGLRLLEDDDACRVMQDARCPFGDGRAAERIADVLGRA